ncbi:MAG: hypothetical protein AVDCRST_MAG70-465 [uncultured Thermomicrobiales bacterium]|uniref:Uncharacterized protein n=1 Tax=uncultured Thermomicrobiales bacterium TaxID=1645740 RepID=A0A6J4UAE4_9BACT|nr:MAG: hypothetical protein AVDCRST_MAG70-465 [uncultured Thermomicrobiales bacterium]
MARSGWCHHPERKRDGLVMVRRNELACNNGWKKDLWEARAEEGTTLPVTVTPLPPATAAEIAAAAVFAQPIRMGSSDGTDDEPRDVVVGEQPSAWRSESAPRQIDVPLATDEIRNTEERGSHGAIRRAHEIQRERTLGQSRHVDLPFSARSPEGAATPSNRIADDAVVATGHERTAADPAPAVPAPDPGTPVDMAAEVAPPALAPTLDIDRGAPLPSRPMRWSQPGSVSGHDGGTVGHRADMGATDAGHGSSLDGASVSISQSVNVERSPLPRRPVPDERPAPVLSWRQGGTSETVAVAPPEAGQAASSRIVDRRGDPGERVAAEPRSAAVAALGRTGGLDATDRPGDTDHARPAERVLPSGEAMVSANDPARDPLVSVTMAERRQWRQRWQSSELLGDNGIAKTTTAPDQKTGDQPRVEIARRPSPVIASPQHRDRTSEPRSTADGGAIVAGQTTTSGTVTRATTRHLGGSPIAMPEGTAGADELVDLPTVSPRDPLVRAGDRIDMIYGEDHLVDFDGADPAAAQRWAAEIAAVPRMCATCRDFRPAESGERGWCTNTHAFTHRRMVTAEEQPCESIIGSWWLPHDMVWLGTDDIQAHGLPTPLVDAHLSDERDDRTGDRVGRLRRTGR